MDSDEYNRPCGYCLVLAISVSGLSGYNAHVTALRHEPALTRYFTIVALEQLSQNLDQMLQTLINRLVADHAALDLPDTKASIMPDIMTNQMDAMNIYQFTSDGQMRLQDQSLWFTLNGQITKRFGAVETILNPTNVDMRLVTPANITLDQSSVLGIYDLPSYDDLPLSDNIAVELSHQHNQTYFTGQVIPAK